MSRETEYQATASEVREGMMVRDPDFPSRINRIERAYPLSADKFFIRMGNGMLGHIYKGTDQITVLSNN